MSDILHVKERYVFKTSIIKKTLCAAAALCTFIMSMPGATAVSSAEQTQEAETTILFADSMFANPTYEQLQKPMGLVSSVATDDATPGFPSPLGCNHGAINIGNALKNITGDNIIDYSCAGASVVSFGDTSTVNNNDKYNRFEDQIDHAIETGVIKQSDNIIIQAGINDMRQNMLNPLQNKQAVIDELTRIIKRVKDNAPQAHITLVGYQAFGDLQGRLCPIRVNRFPDAKGVPLDFFIFKQVEDHTQDALQQVAHNARVDFYDMRTVSANHNMCSANKIRWVAASYEPAKDHNLYTHLTHDGVSAVAQILADEVL